MKLEPTRYADPELIQTLLMEFLKGKEGHDLDASRDLPKD